MAAAENETADQTTFGNRTASGNGTADLDLEPGNVTIVSTTARPARPPTTFDIHLLQWNPHWECFFNNPSGECKRHAEITVHEFLSIYDLDFANLVMLEDAWYEPPAPWKKLSAECDQDTTAILYNSERWNIVGPEEVFDNRSCMTAGRSWRAAAFERIVEPNMGERVIVVGAHFPHAEYLEGATAAAEAIQIKKELARARHVIVLADTNKDNDSRDCGPKATSQCTSRQILEDLRIADASEATTTLPLLTCCADTNFTFSYDRIIATFGSMSTVIDPGSPHMPDVYHRQDDWWKEVLKPHVRSAPTLIDHAAFHRPVVGLLSVPIMRTTTTSSSTATTTTTTMTATTTSTNLRRTTTGARHHDFTTSDEAWTTTRTTTTTTNHVGVISGAGRPIFAALAQVVLAALWAAAP